VVAATEHKAVDNLSHQNSTKLYSLSQVKLFCCTNQNDGKQVNKRQKKTKCSVASAQTAIGHW